MGGGVDDPKLEEDGRKVGAYVIVKRLCSSWCACALIESRLRPIDRCERELSLLERDDGRGGEEAARSADRSSRSTSRARPLAKMRTAGAAEGGDGVRGGYRCNAGSSVGATVHDIIVGPHWSLYVVAVPTPTLLH